MPKPAEPLSPTHNPLVPGSNPGGPTRKAAGLGAFGSPERHRAPAGANESGNTRARGSRVASGPREEKAGARFLKPASRPLEDCGQAAAAIAVAACRRNTSRENDPPGAPHPRTFHSTASVDPPRSAGRRQDRTIIVETTRMYLVRYLPHSAKPVAPARAGGGRMRRCDTSKRRRCFSSSPGFWHVVDQVARRSGSGTPSRSARTPRRASATSLSGDTFSR